MGCKVFFPRVSVVEASEYNMIDNRCEPSVFFLVLCFWEEVMSVLFRNFGMVSVSSSADSDSSDSSDSLSVLSDLNSVLSDSDSVSSDSNLDSSVSNYSSLDASSSYCIDACSLNVRLSIFCGRSSISTL
ncbi:hypothetical protein Glove_578g55 [Diversispora epigaea]|uniref:Uncharacterized protein n=1 Tax=Diversispora epigaea TaxID=1348612 RepID=A0A397G9A6_9GLOM|nr:hypothetical protein Glove_578g55 [Diversispora epigaea]